MRNHRMFSTKILTDDRFTALAPRVQLLYIQLIAAADDEGFVGNLRMMRARKLYLDALVSAGLVHVFSTGPALILHWFCHNAVKATHAKQTLYTAEKALVTLDDQKIYRLKTEQDESGILPTKEKEREEKKSEEKESKEKESKEVKAAAAEASGGTLCDKEKNFSVFWNQYPKKCNEEEAKQTFMACDEDFDTIMEGLSYNKKSNQWVSDNGFFIPDAHKWLKRKGWKDRPPLYKPKTSTVPMGCAGHLGPEELAAIRRTLAEAPVGAATSPTAAQLHPVGADIIRP